MTNAVDNLEGYIQLIGQYCKDNHIDLADLTKAFPARPTTVEQAVEVAVWASNRVAQAVVQDRKPQWVKPLRRSGQPAFVSEPVSAPPAPSLAQYGTDTQVADGYFAVPAGELGFSKPHFFRLKHGAKTGRWAKTQFMTEQASDENYPVKGKRKAEVLRWLASNEQAARELYGTLISRCSRCNRTLTDHDNPYFPAYGPECGGKA